MKVLEILQNVDRRIIYTLMFLSVVVPLIVPMGLPIEATDPSVKDLYKFIEELKPGDKVVLSFDYDPASRPEVHPMSVAVAYHCFKKDLRIIAPSLWPVGPSLATEVFTEISKDFPNKKYGEDYVNLGYISGPTLGVTQVESLCTDIKSARPVDVLGNPFDQVPVLKGVKGLRDVQLVISLSAGDPGIPGWVQIANARYGVKIGAGSTAVQAPQFYPYIQSGQLVGFLGGLRGAAEYETLVKRKGTGTAGMDAQSFAHLLIIILIIMANIMYFLEKRQAKSLKH